MEPVHKFFLFIGFCGLAALCFRVIRFYWIAYGPLPRIDLTDLIEECKTMKFSDTSTASKVVKACRVLGHIAAGNDVYLYGDGFPKPEIGTDSAVAAKVVEQMISVITRVKAWRDSADNDPFPHELRTEINICSQAIQGRQNRDTPSTTIPICSHGGTVDPARRIARLRGDIGRCVS